MVPGCDAPWDSSVGYLDARSENVWARTGLCSFSRRTLPPINMEPDRDPGPFKRKMVRAPPPLFQVPC